MDRNYPACEVSSVPARQAIFEVTSKQEKEMELLQIELQDAMDPQNRPLSNSGIALSIAIGTSNSCIFLLIAHVQPLQSVIKILISEDDACSL